MKPIIGLTILILMALCSYGQCQRNATIVYNMAGGINGKGATIYVEVGYWRVTAPAFNVWAGVMVNNREAVRELSDKSRVVIKEPRLAAYARLGYKVAETDGYVQMVSGWVSTDTDVGISARCCIRLIRGNALLGIEPVYSRLYQAGIYGVLTIGF